MAKKILFTLLTLLVLYSGVAVGYKIFEPENGDSTIGSSAMFQDVISYDTLQDYTYSSGNSAIHYFYFCSPSDQDCQYMETTVLKTVELETQLSLSSLLEYVDVTSLQESGTENRLLEDWGLTTYPAFLTCALKNGQIEIQNSLEWNPQQPLSAADIEDWLSLNKLFTPTNTAEPIATPVS